MKRNFVFLLIITLLAVSCQQLSVIHLEQHQEDKQKNGIIYNLPQTAFLINVDVEKNISIKGPYAEHADKYLGLRNVISSNTESYVIKNIKIETVLIPDTSQYYLIPLPSKFKKDEEYSYILNDNLGFETVGLNLENRENKKASFEINTKPQSYPNLFKLYADNSQVERIDTVYELVQMDSIVMSKPIIKRSLVTKTLEQRAEEAADYILKFRMKRFELLSAYQEVPYSKEAFEYLTRELEDTENKYLELFTGINLTEINSHQFMIVPNKTDRNSSVRIFGFSVSEGITDIDDMDSEIYSIEFESLSSSDYLDTLIVNNIKASKNRGLAYRVPEFCRAHIIVDGEAIPQFHNFQVLQFGNIHYLPSNRAQIMFNENSGSLNYIRLKK